MNAVSAKYQQEKTLELKKKTTQKDIKSMKYYANETNLVNKCEDVSKVEELVNMRK